MVMEVLVAAGGEVPGRLAPSWRPGLREELT